MALHDPEPPRTENALALPPDIGDLCEGRNRAITVWTELRDHYHAQTALASTLCIGGGLGLSAGYDRGHDSCGKLTEKFLRVGEVSHYDDESGKREQMDARVDFVRYATAEIDRRCWHGLLERTGFDTLLDRQAREEFHDSLKTAPPEFTEENCRATFGNIWGSRRDLYLRGIANVFMAMDRRFRSHDAFAIGSRLILERAMYARNFLSGWQNYNRRDTLHDVERIFRELDGVGPVGIGSALAIINLVDQAHRHETLPYVVEGDYFRVRIFGNGNLHLWFTRKDLLKQVNELLLEYYKPVEGDATEGGPSYESGPLFHNTPAKNFGEFFSSEAVAAEVIKRAEISLSRYDSDRRESVSIVPRVLEPSAGGGMIAKAAREKGARVTCVEVQPGLAHELRTVHGLNDVRQADFLKLKPADLGGLFDYVLMNPPFDRGRDCDHVRHAFEFLKPGGTLVAVMSARAEYCEDARHKALHDLVHASGDRWGWVWRDLPERSFAHAGTNVNTVTLKLIKRA